MFFAAVYIHIFRGMYFASYRRRARSCGSWRADLRADDGDCLHGLCAALGPDVRLGRDVITNIFRGHPVIGNPLLELLRGGFSVGNPTLNRFFSLHYLLPFVIAAVLRSISGRCTCPANNNPVGVDVKDSRDTLPFHPYYTMKDAFAWCCS